MKTINATKLGISLVNNNNEMKIILVVKTNQIGSDPIVYLVLKEEFENTEEEDEVRLGFSNNVNGLIQLENVEFLIGYSGMLEKKKNLTVLQ